MTELCEIICLLHAHKIDIIREIKEVLMKQYKDTVNVLLEDEVDSRVIVVIY